jgi:hypothetical protein
MMSLRARTRVETSAPPVFSSSRNVGSSKPRTVTLAPGVTPSFSIRLFG